MALASYRFFGTHFPNQDTNSRTLHFPDLNANFPTSTSHRFYEFCASSIWPEFHKIFTSSVQTRIFKFRETLRSCKTWKLLLSKLMPAIQPMPAIQSIRHSSAAAAPTHTAHLCCLIDLTTSHSTTTSHIISIPPATSPQDKLILFRARSLLWVRSEGPRFGYILA